MKLALKTHRVVTTAALQATLATLASVFGTQLIALPGPAGEGPLSLLVALAGTLLVAGPITRAWPASRTDAVRRPGLVAAAVALLQVAPAALVTTMAASLGAPEALAYAGMLGWLLAIQLAAATLVSATYQGLAPAVYVLLCALGGRIDSVVQPWAWPLADADPVTIALAGAAALGLSLAVLIWRGLHPRGAATASGE